MYYSVINPHDIANGTGIRVSLFTSGCHHHCPHCFNPETWDFNYGEPFTKSSLNKLISFLSPDYISGLSILGGDPLAPENIKTIFEIVKAVNHEYPDKTIWIYTGYKYEYLITLPEFKQLLPYITILVDGPFIESKKDLSLRFCGSSNQRVISIPKSLHFNKIILADLDTL